MNRFTCKLIIRCPNYVTIITDLLEKDDAVIYKFSVYFAISSVIRVLFGRPRSPQHHSFTDLTSALKRKVVQTSLANVNFLTGYRYT